MSAEVRTEEVLPQAVASPAVVACMGVHACNRVCLAADADMPFPKPYEAEGALPYEFDCPSLGESETTVPAIYRRELVQAVGVPTLEFLGPDATVAEAQDYLSYLQTGHERFETYIETLLKGASMPRTASAQAAEAWEGHNYESPNTATFASITEDEKAKLQLLYAQLQGFHDRASLKERGILFDDSMQSVIEQCANELSVGHHVSLSGEPGIAKSTLAKYAGFLNARAHHPEWTEEECLPVLISMSSTSEAEAQVNEQTFEDNTLSSRLGLVAQAMKDGRVVILDEQNGMTADQQVYFNDLFLKKPGEEVRIGKEVVTIAPGFAVIATLNPMTDTQGNRRHGRQQQDSAGAARYTRIDMKYPGQKDYPGDDKETIVRLFYANYVEQYGWQVPSAEVIKLIDDSQEFLLKLAKKATEAPTDGTSTTSALATNAARPDLAECITPRDFSRIMERVMTHSDIAALPKALRQAIRSKAIQILHSDNGHYVTPDVIRSVETDLRNGGFKDA